MGHLHNYLPQLFFMKGDWQNNRCFWRVAISWFNPLNNVMKCQLFNTEFSWFIHIWWSIYILRFNGRNSECEEFWGWFAPCNCVWPLWLVHFSVVLSVSMFFMVIAAREASILLSPVTLVLCCPTATQHINTSLFQPFKIWKRSFFSLFCICLQQVSVSENSYKLWIVNVWHMSTWVWCLLLSHKHHAFEW